MFVNRQLTKSASAKDVRGFSLLEVMVAVLIVSIGLLGVSKMQAAALSNTQIARTRALIALQASSLAAAMHGNNAYWGAITAPVSVTVAGTTVTDATGVLSAEADCVAAVCAKEALAAYDLQHWASAMNDRFPSYNATLNCAATTVNTPSSCAIVITWAEKYIAINRSTTAAAGAVQEIAADADGAPQFSLIVEP